MTQILSCITRNYVLQVSDRRLTRRLPDNALAIYEDCESKADDQTKAIVVNGTMMFAHMGWAKIEGQNTNEWFATVIKPFVDADQLHKGIFEVARRATAYFEKPYDLKEGFLSGDEETLAEAACPHRPPAPRKRGNRGAQRPHVRRLRRGLHVTQ